MPSSTAERSPLLKLSAIAFSSSVGVTSPTASGMALPLAPTDEEKAIAESLSSGERSAVLLGNYAIQHADAAQLHALAQMLADATGATLGFLTEAANTVGAHLAGALPQSGGKNAQAMLSDPCRAYLLLHAEPEFDFANSHGARAALEQADLVVVMSPYDHGRSYADVLLPISPFSETAGSFVNCEGRLQEFHGVVKPLGESRPGWKVLRVLGTMLKLSGFDANTAVEVRASVVANAGAVAGKLGNATRVNATRPAPASSGVERVADVPIYFADPLVRRSPPLQLTADARPPKARMHRSLFDTLGLRDGAQVKVRQGQGEAVLSAIVDATVPPGVVRIAAAHASTCGLEGMSGPISVERA